MKLCIFLLVLVTFVYALPRAKRQLFGFTDPKKVPEMMNNKALVDNYVKCLLATDAEAATICDRVGKNLRANVPITIAKADCPSACTPDEKVAMAQMVKILQDKYPDLWKTLNDHYKVTPEQTVKLNEWIASVTATKTA